MSSCYCWIRKRLEGSEHFLHEVQQLTDYLKSCPRMEGCDEILLPGDPERKLLCQHLKEGLYFDDENWKELTRLAEKLDVSLPQITGCE